MMLLLLWLMTTATSSQEVKPGCEGKYVNVSVPYPSVFEKPDCSMKEHFFLDCSSNDGDAELWFARNMPAYDVSVQEGTVTVSIDMAHDCYDNSGWMDASFFFQSITLGSGLFKLSNFRNMWTAVGCDTEVMAIKAEVTFGRCLSLLCTENVNMSLESLLILDMLSDLNSQLPRAS